MRGTKGDSDIGDLVTLTNSDPIDLGYLSIYFV